MVRKSKGPTFAELLKQPTWSEAEPRVPGEYAVRPGKYNAAGELFDPSGAPIRPQQEYVTPELAQELVNGGALVAHEGCGCGGWQGCQPVWLSVDALRRVRSGQAPELIGSHGTPTWIDVWSSDDGVIVYLHGDVRWGDEIR
ncbi:hypothetical protein LQK93_02639 [Terrabacter sp. BE26]